MLESLGSFVVAFLVRLALAAFDQWRAARAAEQRGADALRAQIDQETADAERRAAHVPERTRDSLAADLDRGVF